jgi:hypothetical protein
MRMLKVYTMPLIYFAKSFNVTPKHNETEYN